MMSKIKQWLKEIVGDRSDTPILDKEASQDFYFWRFMNICTSMFEYEGLPESITQRNLERIIILGGYAGIVNVRGTLYALYGGLGGERNAYYLPTLLTVANPYLNFSGSLKIGEECEIIPNDSCFEGLSELMSRYAVLLTESDITLYRMGINMRDMITLVADNDAGYDSAVDYLKSLEDGKGAVIKDLQFAENGVRVLSSSVQSRDILKAVEYHQYLLGRFQNELGIGGTFNMKRERLAAGEVDSDNNTLLPFVDDMLASRQNGLARVNKMFGTNIKVKLSSAWKIIHEDLSPDHTSHERDEQMKEGESDEIE